MQIRGIPVNIKLNNTVLMIASLIVSVLAGLILGVAGGGRGLNLMLYAVGMAYLKLLFLLAVPLVLLNLISGVIYLRQGYGFFMALRWLAPQSLAWQRELLPDLPRSLPLLPVLLISGCAG